jgi:hypothetical protein
MTDFMNNFMNKYESIKHLNREEGFKKLGELLNSLTIKEKEEVGRYILNKNPELNNIIMGVVKMMEYVGKSHLKTIEKPEVHEGIKNFHHFMLTSKETNFQEYNFDIDIVGDKSDKEGVTAKTKITCFDNSNKTKGIVVSKGDITCSLFSPLDWLDKEYNLVQTQEDKKKITLIRKIKATKHFELSTEEIEIYNAICALIKAKKYNHTIFISYNELHKQLKYKVKLRQTHKNKYTRVLRKLSWLYIDIDISEAKNRKYKKFYELEGNIKEPLIVIVKFKKAKVKFKGTVKEVDGVVVYPTDLMNLHFNHQYQTNKYHTLESTVKKKYIATRKSKENSKTRLIMYVEKLYFLQKNNKKQEFTQISLDKIFEELKEFDMKEKYKKAYETNHKPRFMNRNIFNPIDSLTYVNSVFEDNNGNIKIIWNN